MQEKQLLQINDTVYSFNHTGIGNKYIIEHVTPTTATCGNNKFKRELINGRTKLIGGAISWELTSYGVETQALKDAYEKRQLMYKIVHFDFNKLNLDETKEIVSLIERHKARVLKETNP